MPKRTQNFNAWRLYKLTNPQTAIHYLNAASSDSTKMFLKALKNVVQARFQMAHAARQAGVTRETLYRSLSEEGNPTLETLHSVLSVLGFKIAVASEAPASQAKNAPIPKGRITQSYYRGRPIGRNVHSTNAVVMPQTLSSALPLSSFLGQQLIGMGFTVRLDYTNIAQTGAMIERAAGAGAATAKPLFQNSNIVSLARSYGFGQDSTANISEVGNRIQ